MKTRLMGLAALAAAVAMTGSAEAAQSPIFETNYGVAIVSGDDQVAGGALPFAFNFFGQSFNTFEASTNGFVTLGGSNGTGCCSGDVAGLLSGVARIAPEWFDIVGTAYLNTETAGRAVFTFTGGEYSSGGAYAAQAQLFANGTIIFGYDSDSVPASHTTLTGISLGGGVADPGESNLAAGGFSTSGALAVYDVAAVGAFGLNGSNVVFTPDGNGGYSVSTSLGAVVPEPATWAMMLMGFGGLGGMLRFRRANSLVASS